MIKTPTIVFQVLTLAVAVLSFDSVAAEIRNFEVKDRKPATRWEHAYPVGNGRLGAMPFGDYPKEEILLNEETIWMGRGYVPNSMSAMFVIDEVRRLLWQGEYQEAQDKLMRDFMAKEVQPRGTQPLGSLKLNYLMPSSKIKSTNRTLSLNKGIASSEIWTEDGYHICQEVFSSHPDNVIVVHIKSLTPKKLSLEISLDRYAGAASETIGDDIIVMSGMAKNEFPDPDNKKKLVYTDNQGTCFLGMTKVLSDGWVCSDGRQLRVDNALDLVLLIAAATDYNTDNPYIPLKSDLEKECSETIFAAERQGYQQLLERHIADFCSYFNRAFVDLGTTKKSILEKTTPERIELVRKGAEDPDLIEDLFQMGRYMLIASSRRGTLPPTLTGIWNGNYRPHCVEDWHTNINLQENYWHAELTNLSDLHEPLIALLEDIRKGQGKQMASKLGCRGFVLSHATHAWKESVFSGHPFWGMWPMGGAWCCSHVMEHYRFTSDKNYLKGTAYPILRDNVLFCLDWLTENPQTGELVSGPSTSPENAFFIDGFKGIINICMGPTIDHQIIYESFTDFLEASKILGIADGLTRQVAGARERLAGTKIAPDGRIMEWDKSYKEWEINHRHYSHLYALFPGCEITPETPELFSAAAKTIEGRQYKGGVNHGWSRAWLVNLYARMYEAGKAYDNVLYLVKYNTLPNLMHHEKMLFVDGNGAGTAGIVEMLLQSQGEKNIICFLPSLPQAWKNGSFEGLCARGAFEIGLEWENGQPRQAQVLSKAGNPFHLKYDRNIKVVCRGKKIKTSQRQGVLSFSTRAGEKYTLLF